MPTGYTADLYEGKDISFSDFVLQCARAFGALIEMREDARDATIPKVFEPSNYHRDEMVTAKGRVEAAEHYTDGDWQRLAQQDRDLRHSSWCRSVEKTTRLRGAYEKMLAQVEEWNPPTPEHVGLKDFMVEQLTNSIKFDCTECPVPKRQTWQDYRDQQIKHIADEVAYHQKHWEEDCERAQGRTEWIQALRRSLTAGPVDVNAMSKG